MIKMRPISHKTSLPQDRAGDIQCASKGHMTIFGGLISRGSRVAYESIGGPQCVRQPADKLRKYRHLVNARLICIECFILPYTIFYMSPLFPA